MELTGQSGNTGFKEAENKVEFTRQGERSPDKLLRRVGWFHEFVWNVMTNSAP